jgi:hypothetical protein
VSRGPRARTDIEREFLALGEPAEAFIRQGAAAGMTMLPKEIVEIVTDLLPAHGHELVARGVARAARFSRFRAADVRSILAIGPAIIEPVDVGNDVVVALPTGLRSRSLLMSKPACVASGWQRSAGKHQKCSPPQRRVHEVGWGRADVPVTRCPSSWSKR